MDVHLVDDNSHTILHEGYHGNTICCVFFTTGAKPRYPEESHQNQNSTHAPWTSASAQLTGGTANQLVCEKESENKLLMLYIFELQ